jgi:hypothetical protein
MGVNAIKCEMEGDYELIFEIDYFRLDAKYGYGLKGYCSMKDRIVGNLPLHVNSYRN